LGNSCTRSEVEGKLSREFFPVQLFEEHLRERLTDYMGKRLKDIERVYRETLGYPVPTHVTSIRGALIGLCVRKEIGLRHEKDSACGRRPVLAESEWPDVVISEPFVDEKRVSEFGLGDKDQPSPDGASPEGGEEKEPVPEPEAQESISTVETPFAQSLGELRQEVAVKLSDYADSIVKEVTFRIFYEKKNADLGSLPTGLRGAMTGLGNITADLTITRAGSFGKSDVEQMVEGLPQFPDGNYKAEMKIVIPAGG